MLLSSILSGMLLAINFVFRGGNNMWIPANVRSLGCFSPFDLYPYENVYTASADEVGFSTCFMCTTNFAVLRGSQCVCIENIGHLIRINDTYCDILCDESSSVKDDGIKVPKSELFLCGGNLGGNLYCNTMAGDDCFNASPNKTVVDMYREFGTIAGKDDFQSMESCLDLGCGQPDFSEQYKIYADYFPNLNPEDCVIYCTLKKTSYAHAGWVYHSTVTGKVLFPTCVCTNTTLPANPEGPPCRNGTCPPPLNPLPFMIRDIAETDEHQATSSCGNQDKEDYNWSVYCTTTIIKATEEMDGTPYCAPYENPPDSTWDTCPNMMLTSTQRISSSVLTTPARSVPPKKNPCDECTRRSSAFAESPDGWHFNCENGACFYNETGSYYLIHSNSTDVVQNIDDFWEYANQYCFNINDGHLLAIETTEEFQFITEILTKNLTGVLDDPIPAFLTSGIKLNESTIPYWSFPDATQIPINDTLMGEDCDELYCEGEQPAYLELYYSTEGCGRWKFTRCEKSRYFICEYLQQEMTTPAGVTVSEMLLTTLETITSSEVVTPIDETTPTTTPLVMTTSTSIPLQPVDGCTCVETDIYNVNWTIQANTTKVQLCRQDAKGSASWSCDFDNNDNSRCKVRTRQPNFSGCQSTELATIASNIEVADDDKDLCAAWESLHNFTAPDDTYFGHEIDSILNLIIDLLDRQDDKKMNDTDNLDDYLEFQINTTRTGVRILDNLISHDMQWGQMNQDDRSRSALHLLNVSEDMSFRLADVAELDGRSLRCEIGLMNVTLSSAYWDGNGESPVYDCYLTAATNTSTTTFSSEIFRRFPLTSSRPSVDDSTYLLLPMEAIGVEHLHKGAGVLLFSHHILQQLLPGQQSMVGDNNSNNKQVNSALISYTMRNQITMTHGSDGGGKSRIIQDNYNSQIPEGTFVQLVFQHGELAKDPPVRILHRELNPGETPSAVIGSSYCAFLSYNISSYDEVYNETVWIWDGRGCMLESTNRTHTICHCNHLTGFSTLMDFHDYTGESVPLEITSIVCSMASAISLAITFIVLTVLRSIKSDRTIITQNLCIFLMLSHILTLVTLDRHFLNLDDVTCAAMGVSLHFSLLVSFMWMGIEGLRLCRMVIYVFNLSDWTLYFVLAAYIVPFIIVGITILTAYVTGTGIVSAYVGDETCWLNGANYKWSFAGPITIIILANVIFAIIAVRSSWNLRQNTDRSFEEKIRNAAALSLSLTCLLGISWLTGFLLYAETEIFAYIFTITNGLQGVMIMVFRCILNDEVRTAIKERWKRHKNNRMGKWSSTMTNTTNSQRRQSPANNTDVKLRSNLKLSQTDSRLSVLSNVTKSTDNTFVSNVSINQHYLERRQRNNVRTFSGTEFSDEFSSESRESFSSNGSYRHHYSPSKKKEETRGVARESRRVSFFFKDKHSSPSTPSISEQTLNDDDDSFENNNVFDRRIGNMMFYEQDPSAFF